MRIVLLGDVAIDERLVRLGEREHVRVDPRAQVLERHAQRPEPPIAADHRRRRAQQQAVFDLA